MKKLQSLNESNLPEEQILLFKKNRESAANIALPDFDSIWESGQNQSETDGGIMENRGRQDAMGKFLIVAATLVLFLGVGAGAFYYMRMQKEAPVAENLKAIVVYVKGDAHVLKNDGRKSLYTGDILQGGDRVVTGKDTTVDITLTDHSIVRIRPHTALTISQVARTTENGERINLSIEKGSILNHIDKLTDKDSYRVISPTSVASVRGTTFELRSMERTSTIIVGDGVVHVRELHGDEQSFILEKEKQVTITEKRDEIREAPLAAREQSSEVSEMIRHASNLGMDSRKQIKKLAEVNSESELKKVFNRDLELIQLKDGREMRGVIVSMEKGKLLVQTVEGSHLIEEENVQRVKYLQ